MQQAVFNIPGDDIGNCNPTYGTQGQKGITMWGPENFSAAHNCGTTDLIYFTFTQPQCYQEPAQGEKGTQICNVHFKIHTDTSDTVDDDVGPIHFKINGVDQNWVYRYHSKRGGYDLIEVIELVPFNLLNETGANTIEFVNYDSHVDVRIEDLRIFRTYQMCYLPCDASPTKCNGVSGACVPNITCKAEYPYPEHPDFAQRIDKPCNYESCGGLSWTDFGYNDQITRITPGETVSWEWTNPQNSSSNYIGPISCLFNLNNVTLSNNSQGPDVNFRIRLNGGHWLNYYHSRLQRHQAHGVDLATHPVMQPVYLDSPNDTNVLELQLDAGADVDLVLCDGCDTSCPPCEGGRVNIYRIYQTESVCEAPCQVCNGYCQAGCQVSCYGCELGQGCWPCYGFCQTCVTACELCESSYNWCELCESSYTWPCEICESQCYTSCYTGCEIVCQGGCQSCLGCQSCDTCVSCQMNNAYCDPGCYDCQACNACEPSCYDAQTCYACQVTCFDCEQCYAYY